MTRAATDLTAPTATRAEEQAGRLLRMRKFGQAGEVLVAVRATTDADATATVARALGLSTRDRIEVVCALNERALAELDVVGDTPRQIGPL